MDRISRNGSISRSAGKAGGLYLVLGWIAAIASLIRYPFIFGVIAVVMGILVSKSGRRGGMYLIVASIILMAVGLIFSGVLYNYLKHALGI